MNNIEELLAKVAKLQRLAQSSNPHEAALAAARAQEIIDKYDLDVKDINYDERAAAEEREEVKDYGYDDPLDKIDYLKAWHTHLATTVALANGCKFVYRKIDATGSGRDKGALFRIIGRSSDVAKVRYLYAYFKSEVLRISSEYCDAGSGNTFRRQFRLGVCETLRRRIYESREQTDKVARSENASNSMALVKVNNAIARRDKKLEDVMAFVKKNLGKLRSTGGGGSSTEHGDAARSMGRVAGEKVRLTSSRGAIGSGQRQIN